MYPTKKTTKKKPELKPVNRRVQLVPYVTDPKLPYCVIFDIDGTLACIGERSPYAGELCAVDLPNISIVNLCHLIGMSQIKYDIILMSGRYEGARNATLEWLDKHNIQFNALYMRKQGDFRPDAVIKTEMFNAYIKGKYNVEFVVDDRDQVVKMWRDLGITCLQCAPGNF